MVSPKTSDIISGNLPKRVEKNKQPEIRIINLVIFYIYQLSLKLIINHPDSPYATAMHTRKPPIHPHKPNTSPPNVVANIAAATGSIEKIMAVSDGFNIFCAQIIIRKAAKVAKIPVIKIAMIASFENIICVISSTNKLAKNDNKDATDVCIRKKLIIFSLLNLSCMIICIANDRAHPNVNLSPTLKPFGEIN